MPLQASNDDRSFGVLPCFSGDAKETANDEDDAESADMMLLDPNCLPLEKQMCLGADGEAVRTPYNIPRDKFAAFGRLEVASASEWEPMTNLLVWHRHCPP